MKRWDSYWWQGSIGRNDANGWPVWFIEWGGRGYKRHGAPLFACGLRIGKRYRFIGFSIL